MDFALSCQADSQKLSLSEKMRKRYFEMHACLIRGFNR
jgi:hypothetical protein